MSKNKKKPNNYLYKKLLPAIAEYLDIDKCNVDDFIFHEDNTLTDEEYERCICGVQIQYKYSIKHKKSGDIIYPIGSECIKHFDMEEFNKLEKLKKLNEYTIQGGKLKGYPFNEMTEESLKWWYYKCKSTKKYALDLKLYYKLKYIDKLFQKYIR